METHPTPPRGDAPAVYQLHQLASDVQRLQRSIDTDVHETPTAVLMDCYSEEYTVHTTKNLSSRADELQGQIARLVAEATEARANAAAFRKRVSNLYDRIKTIEQKLQHVRDEKDLMSRQMESVMGEVESAQEDLEDVKRENSAAVRELGP